MELLNRYVTAVGKHLPLKNRADIEAEIRSTLEDMLEDHSQKTGLPVDDALVMEVLKGYGAPEKVAATYHRENYLIGPQLFPTFTMVLKIVFAVITTLAVIGLGIGLGTGVASLETLIKTLGRSLLVYAGTAITTFGNIVLIFAVLERVLPASRLVDEKGKEKRWDPATLMKEPEPDAIHLWEPIMAIIFNFAALVIFNFYPQFIGFTPSLNNLGTGQVVFIPLLSAAFFQYLPWLNILWILEIVLNVILLRQGRWMALTHSFSIALKVLGIGIAYAMLIGPSLVGITPEALSSWPMSSFSAATLSNLLSQIVRLSLVVAILASGINIIKDLYRLVVPTRLKPAVSK